MKFADVLLPLKIPQAYSYAIPEGLKSEVEIGKRVLVSFGKNKFYAGLITQLHDNTPSSLQLKEIEQVLDSQPILSSIQLNFWKWLSDYYMCQLGEVMETALPNYFKLSSERFYKMIDFVDLSQYELEESVQMLLDAIQSMGQISSKEIKENFGSAGMRSLNTLIDYGLIEPVEVIKDKYHVKYDKFVYIQPDFLADKVKLAEIFDSIIKKSPQQYKTLLAYFTIVTDGSKVLKSELIEKSDAGNAVKGLIDKGILIEISEPVDRFRLKKSNTQVSPKLSIKQKEVYSQILQEFETKNVTLLRGITGSGKTEIYIHWIQESLKQNKKALLILPEIALTQQIVGRLNHYFGDDFLVYHSLISHNKRYEIWNRVCRGDFKFIVGTRSSLMLPFQNLDIAIVDEEHDSSLKQSDASPKFHARDSLIHLSQTLKTKILLGSATPSIDTYFNVLNLKYGYVELTERYGEAIPPEVVLIDLKQKEVSDSMKSFYSAPLLNAVEETIALGQQVILFQNRRGYSPYIQCETCAFIQKCDQCDVRLTYHSYHRSLVCHYCNKKYKLYSNCLECKSTALKTKGLGTQKVEEEISLFVPKATLGRLDMDSATSSTKIDAVLQSFKEGQFNTLIGTQMVSKGLDFENLTLVGVIQADVFFSFIDYKTDEKAFQVLSQVSGRVGRGKHKGKVLIQCTDTKHRVIDFVLNQDWKGFVDSEMAIRKEFLYPPYVKLIKIVIRHIKQDLVSIYADKITKKVKESVKSIVLGPTIPPISRIRNQYIQEILIKLPRDKTLQANKESIQAIIQSELITLSNRNFSIDILVDV